MGLMGYTPLVEADGANAGLINSRLIRWERVDAAGLESDRLTLVVDTEGLDGLPSDGGRIRWREGYAETGLWDKGAFRVTRTTPQLFPMAMHIVATAAPFELSIRIYRGHFEQYICLLEHNCLIAVYSNCPELFALLLI